MKMKLMTIMVAALMLPSCIEETQPSNASGSVSKKTVEVATDADGWTIEQKNIAERLKRDNVAGAIKHLYVISPYSGQVILYSTVKGKVTSSGKRLTPTSVAAADGQYVGYAHKGMGVNINGQTKYTEEVLQDDGSYGSSCEYIFWFDVADRQHCHFFTGGQIIHVSDQPLAIKNVIINAEKVE